VNGNLGDTTELIEYYPSVDTEVTHIKFIAYSYYGDTGAGLQHLSCQVLVPTPAPAPAPTPSPTYSPTASPSASPTTSPTPSPTALTKLVLVSAEYTADETLPSGVSSSDLMLSTVYTAAKATGLSAALSVPVSDITMTGFTVGARRLSAAVRQLSDAVSVTTSFTVQVADEGVASDLSTTIVGAADAIKTETDSAMASADWSGESVITAAPTLTTPDVATPVVIVAPTPAAPTPASPPTTATPTPAPLDVVNITPTADSTADSTATVVIVSCSILVMCCLVSGATFAYRMRHRVRSRARVRKPYTRKRSSLRVEYEGDGDIPRSMEFWFIPVDELMRMPADRELPSHQEWRDSGILVKRRMNFDDVMAGNFVGNTAAVSHRWPEQGRFDPEGAKLRKLQAIFKDTPAIKYVWIDWICAPQGEQGERCHEDEVEFGLILENVVPFIFLGCTVIVLYDRIYNQRFWPNLECWIATKMPTGDGLLPASRDRLRMKVYGIESEEGQDMAIHDFVMSNWHRATAEEAIESLCEEDILVANPSDKEICLNVVKRMGERIQLFYPTKPMLSGMEFWFFPVDQFLLLPSNRPIPRHQVLRDMGVLVKRQMNIEDVVAGKFMDSAAVSHRWTTPDHPDPDCTKLRKLQKELAGSSIKYLWLDWTCAPQWHGGGRSDEEDREFRRTLENILPFIFLGCRVIIMYERIYNQRFWPNVECWIATKMPTKDGLMPATADRLRMQVHGIRSARGKDAGSRSFLLAAWHSRSAWDTITALSKDDILVTNKRDKEVNLKVVASLDIQIRGTFTSIKRNETNQAADETSQAAEESNEPEQRGVGSHDLWLPTPGPWLEAPAPGDEHPGDPARARPRSPTKPEQSDEVTLLV
jgi:hypothetical protein